MTVLPLEKIRAAARDETSLRRDTVPAASRLRPLDRVRFPGRAQVSGDDLEQLWWYPKHGLSLSQPRRAGRSQGIKFTL